MKFFIAPLIVGGIISPEVPNVFRLKAREGNVTSHCTGALVSESKFLTAKHCVKPNAEHTAIINGEKIPVQYDVSDSIDLAVGTLKVAQKDIEPFQLDSSVEENKRVEIMGFGCHNTNWDQDDIFRVGFARVEDITPNQYILSGQSFVCPGDSGGPMLFVDKLAGIISAVIPWEYSIVIRLDSAPARALLNRNLIH